MEMNATLKEQATMIAKRYGYGSSDFSLQDKIRVIARTFGCNSGTIVTKPCRGKWRGCSDVSISFDNGRYLYLNTCLTPKAKTKKAQQEFVDDALMRYNPDIVRIKKELAYPALKKLEALDNAIAAEKGLKPYKLLSIEFCNGENQETCGTYTDYMGWYCLVLEVDGKIFNYMETGLKYDIDFGNTERMLTQQRDYYVAAYLRDDDQVDYVFDNVGQSSVRDWQKGKRSL